MKNNNDDSNKPHSKARPTVLSPKSSHISSLCKEAQGFLDFLDTEPPPPDNTDQLEREKLFSKLKTQLDEL